ncbi:MAG: hypothetical protein MZV65_22005 [Chromatiales bacterium]|nr:hypothetical protein [Chromatiales bacterium]
MSEARRGHHDQQRSIRLVILVRPRIYIGETISIGPGKIDLLRLIGETQSVPPPPARWRSPTNVPAS